VSAIDASPEMIAKARRKAKNAQLDITFSTIWVRELHARSSVGTP
jgi:2-polyprenyl-3-methyl-5-hydroxy-6-metoxy-1,4-benzoquinol methylase